MVFWPGYLSQDQLRKHESSMHDEAGESTWEDRFLCLQVRQTWFPSLAPLPLSCPETKTC